MYMETCIRNGQETTAGYVCMYKETIETTTLNIVISFTVLTCLVMVAPEQKTQDCILLVISFILSMHYVTAVVKLCYTTSHFLSKSVVVSTLVGF